MVNPGIGWCFKAKKKKTFLATCPQLIRKDDLLRRQKWSKQTVAPVGSLTAIPTVKGTEFTVQRKTVHPSHQQPMVLALERSPLERLCAHTGAKWQFSSIRTVGVTCQNKECHTRLVLITYSECWEPAKRNLQTLLCPNINAVAWMAAGLWSAPFLDFNKIFLRLWNHCYSAGGRLSSCDTHLSIAT